MPHTKALIQAIKIAGGKSELARIIGVVPSNPHMWIIRKRTPAEHCPSIERATGVLCEKLRPEVDWEFLRGTAKKAKK